MKNSQTTKPPVTITVAKNRFWLGLIFLALFIGAGMYYYFMKHIPKDLNNQLKKSESRNKLLAQENTALKFRNDELLIENGSLLQLAESEQMRTAELEAQANIVEKIKQDSFSQMEIYRKKLATQSKQIEFYNELMSPSVKQELQCFNMDVKLGKSYVDYGLNLMLDKKAERVRNFKVEFRLLSGSNTSITEKLPEELLPDLTRSVSLRNSVRLTGKIKHNNRLSGLKVLDVRIFNNSKDLVAQCWKVF